jgi:hypothetical protein
MFAVLQGIIIGLALGFSQYCILSQHLRKRSNSWIFATTIGYSISNPILMFILYPAILGKLYHQNQPLRLKESPS